MAPLIKPLTKLTNAQALALVERWIARKSKAPAPRPTAGPTMDPGVLASVRPYAPTSAADYGQMLDTQVPRGAAPRLVTQPMEEAMRTYIEEPTRYRPNPAISSSPVSHYFPTERGGPLDATGELGGGIAKELMRIRNPIPSSTPTMGSITRELTGENLKPPVGPVQKFADDRARKLGPPQPKKESPIGLKDTILLASHLDDIWQTIGGARSASGLMWKNYWQQSSQRHNLKSAKDFFISTAIRYKDNPEETKRLLPRETNLLKKIYEIYKEKTGIDPIGLGGIE